jgi:hypothetical protein
MNTKSDTVKTGFSLSSLAQVQLGARHTAMLESAKSACGGSAAWRHRKLAEGADLCRLAEVCGRLVIGQLDLSVDLRADLLLGVTVPCLPDAAGPLVIAEAARLGLIYREEAIVLPQPGYSFVRILAPHPVWLPNASPDLVQALCLGPSLPAGIPVRELILLTYGALTMMSVQMDPANSAGVLNPAAAEWFQRGTSRIPLSRAPFMQPANTTR